MTIIGIVGNTKEFGLSEETPDGATLPWTRIAGLEACWFASLAIQWHGELRCAMPSREFDPQTAVANVETLEMARKDTLTPPRVLTSLLSLFAGLALLIALSSIGGILPLPVSQLVKEIGIRIALGAQPSNILG